MPLWRSYGARMALVWRSYVSVVGLVWSSHKNAKLHKKPADGKPPAGLCICIYALIYTMCSLCKCLFSHFGKIGKGCFVFVSNLSQYFTVELNTSKL